MLKHIYKAIILVCIFVAAIFYFSRDMKEVIFRVEKTTTMENATLPVVMVQVDNNIINLAHGYKSNIDANLMRDDCIPIGSDKTFNLLIEENGNLIKKLKYEVCNFSDNELVYENTISVLEESNHKKIATIKVPIELVEGKEYAVKLTLIASDGEKIYYYYRIKQYNEVYLDEKLQFVLDFHKSIVENKQENIIRYLETKSTADNSNLAEVSIYSSAENVCFNELHPVVLTEIVPKIKEIYSDTGSFVLSYMAEIVINGKKEIFEVEEFYRIRFTKTRTYLLNYNRSMEALFHPELVSITKSQLKLGITNDTEVDYILSPNKDRLAFVRNRELWYYYLADQSMTKVFSFSETKDADNRERFNQHQVMLVDMDDKENLYFVVYGYMNRGQYEGKIAMVLYQYVLEENRIEEIVSIPVYVPFQILKEQFGDFAYISDSKMFYYYFNESLYAYNITTKENQILVENLDKKDMIYCPELKYLAWQEKDGTRLSGIAVFLLESGEKLDINPNKMEGIKLLDIIDNNLVYGSYHEDEMITSVIGNVLYPLYQVKIADVNLKTLKTYKMPGYYTLDVSVSDNVIKLDRITMSGNSYEQTSPDYIMNQVNIKQQVIEIRTRVTDEALTESYLTLPSGFVMKKVPQVKNAVLTILREDRMLRILQEHKKEQYYAYIKSGIYGSFDKVAEAVKIADEMAGVVVDANHTVVWERGIKQTKATCKRFEDLEKDTLFTDSLKASLWYLVNYSEQYKNQMDEDIFEQDFAKLLESTKKYGVMLLEGVSFEEICYYVSKDRPVMALLKGNEAAIIYGYDGNFVYLYHPIKDKYEKLTIKKATDEFVLMGNIFITIK